MATALDVYYPFDAGAGANITEDQWREMARFWISDGPLAGEDNELLAYGDSSGMQVKVKTGKAFVRGHFGKVTSEKTLPIAAVGGIAGGSSRLDRVVLRADFTNNRIEVDVVAGTPATTGTQVAPALTQSSTIWEISLATVGPLTNATSTIAAGTVTDIRVLIVGGKSNDLFVRKTADESVTSSTVLQNDNHLVVALAANSTYLIELGLFHVADTAGDTKIDLACPAGVTTLFGDQEENATAVDLSTTSKVLSDSTGIVRLSQLWGIVRTAGTAGNMQLRFAQNTSSATATTMKADSYMTAKKVA